MAGRFDTDGRTMIAGSVAMEDTYDPNAGDGPHADVGEKLVDTRTSVGERQYAMWIHLGCLLGVLAAAATGGGLFFAPIVVALIMWSIKRHDSGFIDDHGREAANFHLSMLLIALALTVLVPFTCGVSWLVLLVLLIVALIAMIRGSIAAGNSEYFRYPMTWRFLS